MHRKGTSALIVTCLLVLLSGCLPSPSAPPPPFVTPAASSTPFTPASPKVDILRAAWVYVHQRYPDQPWPDDVYVVPGVAFVAQENRRHTHVVFSNHKTGFFWEGEVIWRAGPGGACAGIELVHELSASLPPKPSPAPQGSPAGAGSPSAQPYV